MKFTKMHGLGNDFIIIDGIENDLSKVDLPAAASKLCDRNFGIGADGLIILESSKLAEARMRILNSDGSEPEMCGNGIRCFARYLFEKNGGKKDIFSVETLAGIMVPVIIQENGKVKAVEVDMGPPRLLRKEIPMIGDQPDQMVIEELLDISRSKIQNPKSKIAITAVSMGNPHCVIFVDDVHKADVKGLGPIIETAAVFPAKTNVEFIQVIDDKHIIMRVWERGVGETLACGTGACASAVAGVLTGKTGREVDVQLAGGDLLIEWLEEDNHVYMTGAAETVFTGEIDL
ncbi:MAG: diaminopimelate epimerase [Candidatus Margulisiibacteriota bacterium]|jgi:diaminopimelate epimerase